MTTSLGHLASGQFIIHGKVQGTAVLKGNAVVLAPAATMPTGDPQLYVADFGSVPPTNPPVFAIELTSVGANNAFIGVAMEDIAVGEVGKICAYGPVRALTGADVAAGELLQVDASDDTFLDHASGSIHAIAIEDGHATNLTWVMVTPQPGLQAVAATVMVALTTAFGTGIDSMADVTASFSQTILNSNFASAVDKIAEIRAVLVLHGFLTA